MAHQDTCSICLEPLIQHAGDESMEPIGAAMCGHCFHCDCFWKWEQAKSAQNWRARRYNAACPCPVCNRPVLEFIRLYISGDKSEHEKLKKELKSAKKQLAQERVRLQRTQQELLAATSTTQRTMTASATSTPRPRQKTKSFSSRLAGCGVSEDDINDLCTTVRMLLSAPSTPQTATNLHQQEPSRSRPSPYRRHESYSINQTTSTSTGNCENPSISTLSFPPRPERRNRGSGSTRRSMTANGTNTNSRSTVSGPTRTSAPANAPPRPDPPLESSTSTQSNRSTTSGDASSDVSSLSSLLWFPEYEPPSCRGSQQERVDAAETRPIRISSGPARESIGNSLGIDPPRA